MATPRAPEKKPPLGQALQVSALTLDLSDYSISGRQDVSQLAYGVLAVVLGGDRLVQVQGAAADQAGAVVRGQRCQGGELDDRVPLSQGTMLYRMLDELGVDVKMVIYPRTSHGAREPKLRMEMPADIMRRRISRSSRVWCA